MWRRVALMAFLTVTGGCAPGWQEFTSTDGRFRAVFPGQPSQRIERVDTPTGVVEVHWLGVTPRPWWPRDPTMYLLCYSDFSTASATEGRFAEAKDRMSRYLRVQLGANFKGSSSATINGLSSMDLEFDRPNGTIARCRVILAGSRTYVLTVVGPRNSVDSAHDGGAFLSSLQVHETGS